jgi:endonuclease YncB( thermonuclease family)
MRFAIIALAAVGLLACGDGSPFDGSSPTTAPPGVVDANATVEYIVDGDTIDVMIDGAKERIRFTGINTPEKARRDTGAPAQCFGDEATAFTKSLLPVGTPVRLERDVVGRDDYGRILAYVYRADDGIFVNYEIVRQGYAQPLTIPPNVTHAELMVQAARDAERDDVGLWSACG